MSKLIGYMEGTDPLWLTTLQAQGHGTKPLGNGLDGHGLNMRLLTKHNKPDLIICYLHKLISPEGEDVSAEELLLSARLYGVPVIVVCPQTLQAEACKILALQDCEVELTDPVNVMDAAAKLLH